MTLTPLEIRKQEFARAFRGLEPEDVKQFLSVVAADWEAMLDEQRRRQDQIDELRSKIEHYQKIEEALQEALNTARENALRVTQQAEEKASLVVEQAETRAQQIVADADTKAREIVDEADSTRRATEDENRRRIQEVEGEARQLKQEIARLTGHRSEILARLRNFLRSELEILAGYEEYAPVAAIEETPAEEVESSAPESEVDVELVEGAEVEGDTSVVEDETSEVVADPEPVDGSEEAPDDTTAVEDPESIFEMEAGDMIEEYESEADPEVESDPAPESEQEVPELFGVEEEPGEMPEPVNPESSEHIADAEPSGEDVEDSDEMKKIRRILRDLN
jgi:cell division initiation protein